MQLDIPLLSLVLWTPLAGALVLATLPRTNRTAIRAVAFLASSGAFLLSLLAAIAFRPGVAGMQLSESASWIRALDIRYALGLDGLSVLLVLLTTFLTPLVVLSAFEQVKKHPKEFYVSLLALETGMLGVFLATDLFLFYVFWEAMLLPMVLLIGVWGGPRRIHASVKFLLFTMAGSLAMLLAVLFIYRVAGTFQIAEIPGRLHLGSGEELLCFAAFALSFAIKVPMFPFHTWLPDAHVEAPTSGSVLLAGVLLKMGTYGFVRFCLPFFPVASQEAAPLMVALALVGVVYGAFLALAQTDLKKLVAYSSISHLGFVVLGIFAAVLAGAAGRKGQAALTGAVFQMVAHGLSTGALFLLVGMIYERRHTREISDYGGLGRATPVFATVLVIVSLASIGLPGLAGFVGEFLILLGAAQVHWALAAAGGLGVVLGAVYMLYMVHRVVWGPVDRPANRDLADMAPLERAYMLPILLAILVLGIFPGIAVERVQYTCGALLRDVEVRAAEVRRSRAAAGRVGLAEPARGEARGR